MDLTTNQIILFVLLGLLLIVTLNIGNNIGHYYRYRNTYVDKDAAISLMSMGTPPTEQALQKMLGEIKCDYIRDRGQGHYEFDNHDVYVSKISNMSLQVFVINRKDVEGEK